MKVFIILLMIFCHIIDDYYLQGILASMKQKSWWRENAPQDLYKHDYIAALIMHGFSWAMMTMLPALVYLFVTGAAINMTLINILMLLHALCHALIDHLKANVRALNLVQDQCLHIAMVAAVGCILL